MVQTRTTDCGNSLRRHWLHGEQTNGRTRTAQRDPEGILNHSQLYANGKPGWCLKHQPGNPRRRCYPCQGAAIGRPVFFAPPFFSFEKERNRRGVRRSQLHSVSAGAAKTPYPQPSSSFPNCDRFTGSQFGHLEFYNAARDLDDGGKAVTFGYGKN